MKTVEIHTPPPKKKIGISTVFISETFSLFFLGRVFISTVCISETLSLFLVGFSSQQFAFQKPSPYFFVGFSSQQFAFQKPSPYFFCVVWISTVFISENRKKVSEMKTVEINPLQKK